MSSCCSTETSSAADHHVAEEPAGACINVLINAGAGCTAPPPTPMAATTTTTLSATSVDDLLSSAVPTCNDPHYEITASAPTDSTLAPSRADLDALAHYLSQQSLLSTPNLHLASPGTLSRKRRSFAAGRPATAATNTIADIVGTTTSGEQQEAAARRLSRILQQQGQVMQTFSYSVGGMQTAAGFCEESRRGIWRACQEVGAFYINASMEEDAQHMGMKKLDATFSPSQLQHAALMDHLLLQLQLPGCSSNSMCAGSGPLVPLSQYLPITPHDDHQTPTIPLLQEDDAFQLLSLLEDQMQQTFQAADGDTNFREIMTKFTKDLLKISEDLLKLLLEDVCIETQAKIRGHSLKPLLHICNNGKAASNCMRHIDDDVVFSLSYDIVTHQGATKSDYSLLAILGNQIQTWSEGKYKAPILNSLCNLYSGEVCIQLDLIQHY